MFTIKKNKLYWLITILLLWKFPPLGFTLLITKKGEESFFDKIMNFKKRNFKKLLVLYITSPIFLTIYLVSNAATTNKITPIFENFLSDGALTFEFKQKTSGIEDTLNRQVYLAFNNMQLVDFNTIKGWLAYMTSSYTTKADLNGYEIAVKSNEKCGQLLNDKMEWVYGCDKEELTFTIGSKNKTYLNTLNNTEFKYGKLLPLLGFWKYISNIFIIEIPKEIEPNVFEGEVQLTYSRYYKKDAFSSVKEKETSNTEIFDAKVYVTKGSLSLVSNTNLSKNQNIQPSQSFTVNPSADSSENKYVEMNDEPSFAGDFMGFWKGQSEKNKITLYIETVWGDSLSGYIEIDEVKKNIKGLATENDDFYTIIFSKNNGVNNLNLTIYKADIHKAIGILNDESSNSNSVIELYMQ